MTSLLWINSYLNPDYICAKCLSLVVIFIILISHHRASSKVWLQLTLLSKLKTEQTYCKNMHTNTCPMIEPQVNIKKRKGRMRWRATAHAHAHRAFPRGTVRSVSTCSHLIRGGAWQAQVSQSPGGTTEADEERKLIKAQFNVRTVGGAETTWKLLRSWKPPGSFTEPQKSSNLLNQLISSPRTYNDQRPLHFFMFSPFMLDQWVLITFTNTSTETLLIFLLPGKFTGMNSQVWTESSRCSAGVPSSSVRSTSERHRDADDR